MQIEGSWSLCDDGIVRPLIYGAVLTGSGSWEPVEFLVDTGADRTVFSESTLTRLGLESILTEDRLGGLGGVVDHVIVETQVRLTHDTGSGVIFRGQYAAVTDP